MRFLSKQSLLAVLLCAPASAQVALAYEVITTYENIWTRPDTPPISLSIPPPNYVFCHTGGPCIGSWTSLNMPFLTTDQVTSISTDSTDFNYYLGSDLSGTYRVSLSPVYIDGWPPVDELHAKLATSEAVIGTTSNGNLTFLASSGMQYYLLLNGLVRGGETYSLSVSAVPAPVPTPAAWTLLVSGLGLLSMARRRR